MKSILNVGYLSAPFDNGDVAWLLLLLLLSMVMISTLKRTLRDRNLSGDRYSHLNRLGELILWMRSAVYTITN